MKHRDAYDFCDECGRERLKVKLKEMLCEECRPPWQHSDLKDDELYNKWEDEL